MKYREMATKELAEVIASSGEWNLDALAELCRRANLEDEWEAADGDTFEAVAFKAADVLGVEIL